jgi:hypothetical protein
MYISNDRINEIDEIILAMNISENESLLLLIGEETKIDFEELIAKLNSFDLSFFGGIFPGIIYDKNNYTNGIILKVLPHAAKPILIKGWKKEDFDISPFLKDIPTENIDMSFFTIVDGLTSDVSSYLQQLYHHYGNSVKFMGAGAGSISLVQRPCVFTNEGIFQDAAVLFPLKMKMHLGVKHGWERLAGPIVATRTENNIIHELNWKNAFEVYREIVEKDSQRKFNDQNFFEIAKAYPIGKIREIGEDICRDPLSVTTDGSIVCAGKVPENTVLYIMKGDIEVLVQSAAIAVKNAIKQLDTKIEHILVVDCISRALFLGEEELSKELAVISKTMIDSPIEKSIPQGILSIGEISSGNNGFLELYNKTLVIGALTK